MNVDVYGIFLCYYDNNEDDAMEGHLQISMGVWVNNNLMLVVIIIDQLLKTLHIPRLH